MNSENIKTADKAIVREGFWLHWPIVIGGYPQKPRCCGGTVISLKHPISKEWVVGQEHKLMATEEEVNEGPIISRAAHLVTEYNARIANEEILTPTRPKDKVAHNRDTADSVDLGGKIMTPQEKPASRKEPRNG